MKKITLITLTVGLLFGFNACKPKNAGNAVSSDAASKAAKFKI